MLLEFFLQHPRPPSSTLSIMLTIVWDLLMCVTLHQLLTATPRNMNLKQPPTKSVLPGRHLYPSTCQWMTSFVSACLWTQAQKVCHCLSFRPAFYSIQQQDQKVVLNALQSQATLTRIVHSILDSHVLILCFIACTDRVGVTVQVNDT